MGIHEDVNKIVEKANEDQDFNNDILKIAKEFYKQTKNSGYLSKNNQYSVSIDGGVRVTSSDSSRLCAKWNSIAKTINKNAVVSFNKGLPFWFRISSQPTINSTMKSSVYFKNL